MTSRNLGAYALGWAVAVAVILLAWGGYFEAVENRFIDWKFRGRAVDQEIDPNIVLVEVTDQCLRDVGDLPWRRRHWARLVDATRIGGARVVAVDALFDEGSKDPAADELLSDSLQRAGNVLLAAELKTRVVLENETGSLRKEVFVQRPLAPLDRAARGAGIVNVDYVYENVDGILRLWPLAHRVAGDLKPSLPLAAASEYLDVKPSLTAGGSLRIGTYTVPEASPRRRQGLDRLDGEHIRWSAAASSAWVNYSASTAKGLFPRVRASELLALLAQRDEARQLPASDPRRVTVETHVAGELAIFRAKLVLVGVTATAIDVKNTPFGPMPGVQVQANVVRNLLEHAFLSRIPDYVQIPAWILLGFALPVALLRLGLMTSALLALTACGSVLAASLDLFHTRGVLLDALPPASLIAGQFVVMKLFLLAADLRRRIRSLELLTLFSRRFNSTLNLDELHVIILESFAVQAHADAAVLVLPGAMPDELEAFVDGTGGSGRLPEGITEWMFGGDLRRALFRRWSDSPRPIVLSELSGYPPPGGFRDSEVVFVPLLHRDAAEGWILLLGQDLEPGLTGEEELTFWGTLSSIAFTALQNARHYMLATVDGLTRLQVRHIFDLEIEKEFGRATRYNGRLSLLLTDIDHFKSFNDTYGHQLGDRVLRLVADQVKRSIRLSDTASRYGGEEFAVVLPETDYDGAKLLAERIRSRIEELRIPYEDRFLEVTISIGLSSIGLSRARNAKGFISEADEALYAAKHGGRNQVKAFGLEVGEGEGREESNEE